MHYSKTLIKFRHSNSFWLFVSALFLPLFSISMNFNNSFEINFPVEVESNQDVLDTKKVLNASNRTKSSFKFNAFTSPQDSTKKTSSDTSKKDLTYPIKKNTGREKNDYQNNIDHKI